MEFNRKLINSRWMGFAIPRTVITQGRRNERHGVVQQKKQ
jgi:hypothetical protein